MKTFLASFLFLCVAGLSPLTVHAAAVKAFEALSVQVPAKFSMAPGETKSVTVTFQNIGSKTWTNTGAGFISVYTQDAKYRVSAFKNASWVDVAQPAILKEARVATGSVGTVVFSLTAPKTPGNYAETFQLASESTAWISGGKFTLNITVANATSGSLSTAPSTTSIYHADVLTMSEPSITAKGGVSIVYTATFKNIGSTSWGAHTLAPNQVRIADVSASDIHHKSWKSSSVVLERASAVAPGGSETLSFAFLTPKYKGSYNLAFQLAVDGQSVEGGEIDIPVEVTADAPEVKGSAKTSKKTTTKTKTNAVYTEHIVTEEPTMRVGVLIVDEETDDEVVISADTSAMQLQDASGTVLAEVKKGKGIKAYYKSGKYYYEVDGKKEKTTSVLRFVPTEVNSVLTVTNFDRRLTRGSAYADNQFRNILEIRYNSTKDRVWLINELPFSFYSRGSAETSDASDAEFKKALMVAWNTYAYKLALLGTKHDEEGFIADAYADQVYKGYGQEVRTPTLTKAIDDTRGIIVTYQGEVAITPYFSRSDGRTRDWSEVWGGDVPWCKGVDVPEDAGKTLWGHGVGMSASGALQMAKDGKTYDQILKHFYTGVELQKMWK